MANPLANRGTNTAVRRRSFRTMAVVLTFAGLLLCGAIYALVAIMFAVRGTEFSPQTFERRRFSVIRAPIIGWQLTGVSHTAVPAPVEEQLIADKLITPRPKDQSWDCITLESGAGGRDGDAKILTDFLDANGPGDVRIWIDWTEKHPESAKVFWPVVMQTAEEGMYLLMPDLFRAARSADEKDTGAFTEKLKSIRTTGYRSAAAREEKLNRVGVAAEFYRRASNLDPADAELQEAARRTAAEAKAAQEAKPTGA